MMDDMTISENIREHLGKVRAVLQSNTITCVIIILYVLLQTVHTAIPYEYLDAWGVDKTIHIVRTALLYFIILSLLIDTYKILKDTRQCIDDYMIYVFLNVGITMLISIILFIFCTAVDSLMAEKLFYWYYIDVMFGEQVAGRVLVLDTFYLGPVGVFVIGSYFGFKMILTLQGMGEKLGEFRHNLIRDVLHTMILCAIIYAYSHMLVILLAEKVYVSAAISGLFAIWLSVVILAGDNADKIKYGKIISIMSGLMIPLIFLQGCDMTVRIYRYGMRPERYVGMVLFLFEICAMLVHYFGKGKFKRFL